MRNIAYIIIASLAIVGCNDQDAKELGQDTGKLVETAARSARNAGPVVAVNTVLGLRKDVDISGLRVTAEGSTVTIGGHVKSKKEKNTVLELAKNTKGVEKLVDEIRVEP